MGSASFIASSMNKKPSSRRINFEEAHVVGFEEGLSNARVSTVPGIETKGLISLFSPL